MQLDLLLTSIAVNHNALAGINGVSLVARRSAMMGLCVVQGVRQRGYAPTCAHSDSISFVVRP